MIESILQSPHVLAECAVAERLRRRPDIELHPTLFNTPLIYGPEPAREALAAIYREYAAVAQEADCPMLLTAPTWRLDALRTRDAGVPSTINRDAVDFLLQVRSSIDHKPVSVGALIGPRADCYRPELAPDTEAACAFHQTQIDELAGTKADFLLAQTLPSVNEALGIARAIATTDKPYLISFCTGTNGRVLDGTSLPDAMARIDDAADRPPLAHFVNCTHPSYLLKAYQPGELERLAGIQANGSSMDVTQLDGSGETIADPVDEWAEAMLRLHREHGVQVLGGCCGTALAHLRALAAGLTR